MAAIGSRPALDLKLDAFGQMLVTIFTPMCFCFSVSDAASYPAICTTLEDGLERLAEAFPWTAGQVLCQGMTDASTGCFRIRPLGRTPRLMVKDLRDSSVIPPMSDLRRSHFPMSSFDENVISPRKRHSGRPGEAIAEVFQLQATLIDGGVILTFLGQHQAVDGSGQAEVIRLFAKACRNERYTEEELRIGNFAPENVISLLDGDWRPGVELQHNIVKADLSQLGPGGVKIKSPVDKGVWCQFNFNASSLENLKMLATQSLSLNMAFISTDDALTAFIWQAITRARLLRFDGKTEASFARAVDLRKYLGISQSHPGFVQSMTYHKWTMQELSDLPLGIIAADLRAAVDPKTSDLAYHARSFATLIDRTADKTLTSYLAGFDMSKDIMLSSWANQKSYGFDFGHELGMPEAVRRPTLDAFQGLMYLLPRATDGEIGLTVCLSADDMERLKADDNFTRYATIVG